MNIALPAWVEQAAALPLAFAQVREDPLLDCWVVEQLPDQAHVMMIASGGCTAAFLAACPKVTELHLVDPNPVQLALSRLKLQLLNRHTSQGRLALLGHSSMPALERQTRLEAELTALGLSKDVLGPPTFVAEVGPDHAGRYERVFAQLRLVLNDQAESLESLLHLHDAAEQEQRVNPAAPLGQRLDAALDEVMALPNLVRLFGAEATKNPIEPFSRHFARRLRHVLATLPADNNPYLWQMLLGRYPEGHEAPWLRLPSPAQLPSITSGTAFMADALSASTPASFDFVHLSNILDWLTPEKAQATLELAGQALRPGGYTLIRQLNSTLDIPGLGPMFEWLIPEANKLHARDRSFFYRALHLGEEAMNVYSFQAAPPPEMAQALGHFEEQFRYPLGPGRFFRISHGEDYPRFFRAMGEGICFVAERDGKVLGVIGTALRRLTLPNGMEQQSLYLGDLKIDPTARGGRALPRLADAVRQWVGKRVTSAFAVVMDGTPVTPERYTGRLGIPSFEVLGKVMVLRLSTMGSHATREKEQGIDEEAGTTCYLRLSEGRYACPGGNPAERSEMEPLWLMTPAGGACGRLEDTLRAKRLISDDGLQMRSAHLSCFAYRDVSAGVALLRMALGYAAARGLPALFVAVAAAEAEDFRRLLEGMEPVLAPATVYGTGLKPGSLWNINTAEI